MELWERGARQATACALCYSEKPPIETQSQKSPRVSRKHASAPSLAGIAAPDPVRLTNLAVGHRARLHATDLPRQDCELLSALGLASGSRFRVCRAGDPWIVEVRSTRIGFADAVARQLLVLPEPAA